MYVHCHLHVILLTVGIVGQSMFTMQLMFTRLNPCYCWTVVTLHHSYQNMLNAWATVSASQPAGPSALFLYCVFKFIDK